MYILTQSESFENSRDKIYRVQSTELVKQYLDAGYQSRERSYKIKYQYKEYTIICLEFRNGEEDGEPIVIIPEFLLPRRPYPVYIYLYAIDLYSGTPEKGQRFAAVETRKRFGLESFAHTTLGRALKAFVHNIEELTKAPENICLGTPSDGEKKSESQKEDTGPMDRARKPGFPTVQSTGTLRKRAAQFLHGMLTHAGKQQAIATCHELARKWFKEYKQFLL